MISATQAKQLSNAFDVAAHHQKMHNSWVESLDRMISNATKSGDTNLQWVPGLNPTQYPEEVHASVKATLVEAGYKVEVNDANIWQISWA
jgi:hypothetical protein